jgi:hypothetical protein
MNFLRFILLLEKAAFMITKKHLKEEKLFNDIPV